MFRMRPFWISRYRSATRSSASSSIERVLVGNVAAFAMRDREAWRIWPFLASFVNGESGGDHFAVRTSRQMNLRLCVPHQRARQQPALDQDLKAVADAKHQAAIGSELLHGAHDGRKFGDRAAAQIVAIRKSARQNHRIHITQRWRIVPDEIRLLMRDLLTAYHASWSQLLPGNTTTPIFMGETLS